MSNHIIASSDELIVWINRGGAMYELLGTRAALEAEGLIPPELTWPEGFHSEYWDVGKLRYRLSRRRPSGAKGPRQNFLEVDWWGIFCFQINPQSFEEREVARKEAELHRARYRASEAGAREWVTFCERYRAMRTDKAYHAFIGKVLGVGKRLLPAFPRSSSWGVAS